MLSMPPLMMHSSAARADQVDREHRGLHAGSADFVDGRSSGRVAKSGDPHGLTCRRLFQSRADDVADDHLVDLLSGQACVIQCGADCVRAEFRGAQGLKRTLKAADRSTSGAEHEDVGLRVGVCHGRISVEKAGDFT